MGDLSENFSRSEFACKCGCGFDTVDIKIPEILERVRTMYKSPITITSGCRCPTHNASVGGAANSLHTLGRAADFKVKDISSERVYKYLCAIYPNKYGFGLYPGWTHLDSRSKELARWQK